MADPTGMEKFRQVEQRLQPKATRPPVITPDTYQQLVSYRRNVIEPEEAQRSVLYERVFAQLPEGERLIRSYLNTGKRDDRATDYMDHRLDRLADLTGLNRKQVGQLLFTGVWGTFGKDPNQKFVSWALGQSASDLGFDFEVPESGFGSDTTEYLRSLSTSHKGVGQLLEDVQAGRDATVPKEFLPPSLTRVSAAYPEQFNFSDSYVKAMQGAAGIVSSVMGKIEDEAVAPVSGRLLMLGEAAGLRGGEWGFQRPSLSKLTRVATMSTDEARDYLRNQPFLSQAVAETLVTLPFFKSAPRMPESPSENLASRLLASGYRWSAGLTEEEIAGITSKELLQADAIVRSALMVRKSDVGRVVSLQGKAGTLSGVRKGWAEVRLWEGGTVRSPVQDVLRIPGGGSALDLESEATLIRLGKHVDDVLPLTYTPGGLERESVGTLRLYQGTVDEASESIVQGRIRLSEASTGRLNATYLTASPEEAGTYARLAAKPEIARVTKLTREAEESLVHAEVPNNLKTIKMGEVEALRRELGLGNDNAAWQKLSDELRGRGFQAVDLSGEGGHAAGDVAILDNSLITVKASTPARSSWFSFLDVADSVMADNANVLILAPGKGASPYTPALQLLGRYVFDTQFDTQQFMLSASRAAKTVIMPDGVVGKLWLAARRPFNRALGQYTAEAFFAGFNHRQLEQTMMATKLLFLKKSIQEAFGTNVLRNIATRPFLDAYTGPKAASEAERFVIGSFMDMVENSHLYKIPDEWAPLMKVWQKALDHDFELMQRLGFPGELIGHAYVPHMRGKVEGSIIDGFLRERAGGRALPAGVQHPGFTRGRKYPTIREWSDFLFKHNEQPELDPLRLYASRLTTTSNMRTNQVYIQGVLEAYGKPILKGKTPTPGWAELFHAPPSSTRVLPGIRTGRWQVPLDVASEVSRAMSQKPLGPIEGAVNEGVDWFRQTLLSLDFSWITQQGYALALISPTTFLQNAGRAARVAMSEEGFLLDFAMNADSYAFAVRSGLTTYASPADVVPSLARSHWVDRTPVTGALNRAGYGRFLPYLKRKQFEMTYQQLLNLQQEKGLGGWFAKHIPGLKGLSGIEGKTPEQLAEVASDFVNNTGGGLNWGRIMYNPSLASRFFLLTEGWLRANMGRIINLGKVGDPKGLLARQWFLKNLALTSSISTILSIPSGRLPSYNPLATDFLDIQLPGGGSVPIFPSKTYARSIMRALVGTPKFKPEGGQEIDWSLGKRGEQIIRFWEGRAGQIPRIGVDLQTGKDYLGRDIDNRLLYTAKNILPLPAQALWDMFSDPTVEGKPFALVAQGMGLNYLPVHPAEVRNSFITSLNLKDPLSGQPVDTYFEMNDQQRKDFDTEYPEYTQAIREYQALYDRPITQLNKERATTQEHIRLLGLALLQVDLPPEQQAIVGTNYKELANNPYLYSRRLRAVQGAYYQKTEGLMEPFEATNSTTNQVLHDYYEKVVTPALEAGGGSMDWEVFAVREAIFRQAVQKRWGDFGIAVLDNELALKSTDDPVAATYHKDQRDWQAYYVFSNSLWTPGNLEAAGMDRSFAKNYPSFDAWRTTSRSTFRDLFEKEGVPAEVGIMRYPDGETLQARFQVPIGTPLTFQQADEVAQEMIRLWSTRYQEGLSYSQESWLIQHPETMWNMRYWGVINTTERLEPYMNMAPQKFP